MGLFSRIRSSIKRAFDGVGEVIEDIKDRLGFGEDGISPSPDAILMDDEDIAEILSDDEPSDIFDHEIIPSSSDDDVDMVAFEYYGDAMEGIDDDRHYYTTDYVITLVTGAEMHGSIKFYGEGGNICAGILASNPDLQSTDVLMIDVLDYPEYSLVNGFSERYGSKY